MREGKVSKAADEASFYRAYFAQTAERMGEQIERYYLLGSRAQRGAESVQGLDKTVSAAYVQRIFRSEQFKKDFLNYL